MNNKILNRVVLFIAGIGFILLVIGSIFISKGLMIQSNYFKSVEVRDEGYYAGLFDGKIGITNEIYKTCANIDPTGAIRKSFTITNEFTGYDFVIKTNKTHCYVKIINWGDVK